MFDTSASTARYIVQFARRQPDAFAVVEGDRGISYRGLADMVARYRTALGDLSVARDTLVGIACDNSMVHLALILAAEAIGAPSMSFLPDEVCRGSDVTRRCDLLICAIEPAPQPGQRVHLITQDWIDGIERTPVRADDWTALEAELDPAQLVRINRTSGTTGRPKLMRNTLALKQKVFTKLNPNFNGLDYSPLRIISPYTLTFRLGYNAVLMPLQTGGMAIFTNTGRLVADAVRFNANYSVLLPADAEREAVAAAHLRPAKFGLVCGGGRLPPATRDLVMRTFATEVFDVYSSNEAGRISFIDHDGICTIYPGVEVKIVDGEGREKPQGEAGLIRVRTDSMIAGYIDDPELTAATFIDGWFQSGDIGIMPAKGRLIVIGRSDDMLNIGGVKVPPSAIEDRLRMMPGVTDAAVVAIAGSTTSGALGVALEAKADVDGERTRQQIADAVGRFIGNVEVGIAFVEKFPRTENGKLQRHMIEELFRSHAAR